MINEANEPSSACRLWRIPQVETSTPPKAAWAISAIDAPGSSCVKTMNSLAA